MDEKYPGLLIKAVRVPPNASMSAFSGPVPRSSIIMTREQTTTSDIKCGA